MEGEKRKKGQFYDNYVGHWPCLCTIPDTVARQVETEKEKVKEKKEVLDNREQID